VELCTFVRLWAQVYVRACVRAVFCVGVGAGGVRRCAAEATNRAAAQSVGREVPEAMKEGMRELLGYHSLDELSILCDDVGVGVGTLLSTSLRMCALVELGVGGSRGATHTRAVVRVLVYTVRRGTLPPTPPFP
jgi:hypothetical protein